MPKRKTEEEKEQKKKALLEKRALKKSARTAAFKRRIQHTKTFNATFFPDLYKKADFKKGKNSGMYAANKGYDKRQEFPGYSQAYIDGYKQGYDEVKAQLTPQQKELKRSDGNSYERQLRQNPNMNLSMNIFSTASANTANKEVPETPSISEAANVIQQLQKK